MLWNSQVKLLSELVDALQKSVNNLIRSGNSQIALNKSMMKMTSTQSKRIDELERRLARQSSILSGCIDEMRARGMIDDDVAADMKAGNVWRRGALN